MGMILLCSLARYFMVVKLKSANPQNNTVTSYQNTQPQQNWQSYYSQQNQPAVAYMQPTPGCVLTWSTDPTGKLIQICGSRKQSSNPTNLGRSVTYSTKTSVNKQTDLDKVFKEYQNLRKR